MSREIDAAHVEQQVAGSLTSSDSDTSSRLLSDADAGLKSLSPSEQSLVENDLSAKGLLPDLAIKTGLVSEDSYITRDELKRIGTEEGNTTLKGMAANFLADNYNLMGGARHDINSDFVQGFDIRMDMGVQTAHAMRELPGLLTATGKSAGTGSEGLTSDDISKLMASPESLSPSQAKALGFMSQHFDYMKAPRGVWNMFGSTTPSITQGSLDEFVDTAVPMGFRGQLEIAQRDYSEHGELAKSAAEAAALRNQPESNPGDGDAPVADSSDADKVVAADDPSERTEDPEPAADSTLPPVEIVGDDAAVDSSAVVPPVDDPAAVDSASTDAPADSAANDPEGVPAEVPAVPPATDGATDDIVVPPVETKPEDSKPADASGDSSVAPVLPADAKPDDASPSDADPASSVPGDGVPTPPATDDEGAADKSDGTDAVPSETDAADKPPTAKEYTVQSGDNLWNISKQYLKEQSGEKPSNKEILELVNKIVAHNSIKNPDLIYPDQKIMIPVEAPPAVTPDTPPQQPEV